VDTGLIVKTAVITVVIFAGEALSREEVEADVTGKTLAGVVPVTSCTRFVAHSAGIVEWNKSGMAAGAD